MIDDVPTSAGQWVDAVRANPNYVPGTPCRLLVCHSGVSGVGQQVADELGAPILAQNSAVGIIREGGSGQIPSVKGDAGWTWLMPNE